MAPAHARPGLPSLGSALTKAMAGTAAAALRLDVQALFEQRGRMMQIATALPDLALVPERAMVREGVSGGFEWVVDCVASHPNFPLKLLIGEQMSLRLLQADGTYKPWHGYVMEAAQLGSDGGLSRYRLVMRPWLAFLAHRHDAFIYREKTVEEIVADVFADHPQANFRFELQRPLPARSVCTQYRESDLAFVERLLAEEGLCTWYEHDAHGPDLAVARHALHRLVITDRFATLPHLGPVRYAMQHPTARLPEQRDSITAFAQHCRVQTQSVVRGSWRPRVLVGSSAERTSAAALALGDLPILEDYDGAGEDRHLDPLHADDVAERHLAALELGLQTHEGDGGARHLEAGRRFTLWDHGALDGDYTLLSIDHHITNNLGAQAARLLAATDLAHGAYRNHFLAVPAERPLVPRARTRPALPGTQTAWIVGHDSPVHTDRDHRVIVQFPWQRGQRPLPGGLPHDPSSPDGSGHAPADDRSTPWVRVALPWAGENWGAVAVPRIGTEVLVAFIEGDIDRPVIVGSLYSGGHRPPFSAGVGSGAGHAGMLSGWHSDALDGGGFNQWVLDDTTGQLRMRLLCHYTLAEVGLGHLIQQAPSGARRGPWRGGGFELGCQAWMTLRGVKGLMLSTHARPGRGESAQGAQLDAQELLARMHGHRQLGQTLHQAAAHAQAQGLSSHLPGHAWDAQHEATDPHRKGHHPPAVGGQDSRQPAPGADPRTPTDPTPALADPLLILDSAARLALATEASLTGFSAQDTSTAASGDIHLLGGHTASLLAGDTASLVAHTQGLQAVAASGPVSMRAYDDRGEMLARQAISIVSTEDDIHIQAPVIRITDGPALIELKGGDILMTMPGVWTAQHATHEFMPAGGKVAQLPAWGAFRLEPGKEELELHYHYDDLEPVVGAAYRVEFDSGEVFQGQLDASGYALISGVPPGPYRVEFSEDARDWQPPPLPPDEAEFRKPEIQAMGKRLLQEALAREAAYDVANGAEGQGDRP